MQQKLIELGKQEQAALSSIATAELNIRNTARQMLHELNKKDPHARSIENQIMRNLLKALLKIK